MLDVREPIDIKPEKDSARTRPESGRVPRKATGKSAGARKGGLKVRHLLTKKGESPFDKVEWERRKASICGDNGNVIFAQEDVEIPVAWSMLATNVVASKYFFGGLDTDEREFSVRQLIHRVARTIADWGLSDGYFASPDDAEAFYSELSHACVNQYGAFNSPVWFNVGLFQVYGHSSQNRSSYTWDEEENAVVLTTDTYKSPQASACFIQSVDDSMEDIMRLASSEAMLFKYGSGTGSDLSTLRSTHEKLSGGGTPSGPISFMRVFDQVAAVIKSGGKTRRAAKMQSLKVWHPDILDFINCKSHEEKKAWALIEQGYDGSFNGEAYDSVMFQNANLSVRVSNEFMECVEHDKEWETRAVKTGEPVGKLKARDVMHQIADNAHLCGDPGLQYDTTINKWHTCPNSAPINASNPCSEYMFVDDSACNLASINLMKFVNDEGDVDIDKFKHVVRLFIIAQDILVDNASYPTELVAMNSHLFRPLGLGYANLGALIMREGMPYDSDEGRAFASMITALLTGEAYKTSQELAAVKGAFDEHETNADCMLNVMKMHRDSLDGISSAVAPAALREAAYTAWNEVVDNAPKHGFRNSQVTVLAPTGTIGFMMDCDTTGVEPDIALVKYKQLAGGGTMKIVNRTIEPALKRLGYTADEVAAVVEFIDENDTIEGAPHFKSEHIEVFDCAFKAVKGSRSISYRAHLRMMAAVQPFLSGAISKTVNLPHEATANDIMQTFIDGWEMGLKAVAVYRDGSKRIQPLRTSEGGGPSTEEVGKDFEKRMAEARRAPFRRRMPATRQSITHKFEVAGHEGYLTVGTYEDGAPGEVFITMAKEGSTVGGTMDAFGTAISLCLQYGVPVQELCQKFAHSRFEPSGFTKNPDIPIAKSIVDYIFRWLDATFPGGTAQKAGPQPVVAEPEAGDDTKPEIHPGQDTSGSDRVDSQFKHFMEDAPVCDQCGSITVRNGACYRCYNCGNSMGCS